MLQTVEVIFKEFRMRHILVLSAVFCMAEPWWIFGVRIFTS